MTHVHTPSQSSRASRAQGEQSMSRKRLELPRKTVVRIAREAIKKYQDRLTPKQRRDLLRVAKTAPLVTRSWTDDRKKGCGCLVGTAYPELFVDGESSRIHKRPNLPLLHVGLSFGNLLEDEIAALEAKPAKHRNRVYVTDEASA